MRLRFPRAILNVQGNTMARPTINEDRKKFLSALGKNTLGNGALRQALGWAESRYWKVHASLLEDARIIKGRGRGGSVARS
jgi:type I restriction enzyme M protein